MLKPDHNQFLFLHLYIQLLSIQMKIEKAIKATGEIEITTKSIINIMYTSRFIEDLNASLLKRSDLTSQQYNVLRILRGQKGNPANLSTLQERMIDRNSNTTRLVDKLISKGLVERQTCEKNRRKVEIFITGDGMDLLSELDPTIDQLNKDMMNNLTNKQMEDLNGILNSIRTI